ncbi:hypothetical protein [Paenibacillus kandeliae]|uniref:hypothetical protein n=1 Tax=Paenibacillus kandeliae TaxID=3231269 RepID=UPI0034575E97
MKKSLLIAMTILLTACSKTSDNLQTESDPQLHSLPIPAASFITSQPASCKDVRCYNLNVSADNLKSQYVLSLLDAGWTVNSIESTKVLQATKDQVQYLIFLSKSNQENASTLTIRAQ